MKRFLSLVLSALFVFQLGNASCDAVSHSRSEAYDNSKWQYLPQSARQEQLSMQQQLPMQQQSTTRGTAPKQSSLVLNLTTTPQNITVQSPVNIKKVDATTWGDKLSGWIKCVLWGLLAGGVAFLGYGLWSSSWPSLREMILSKSNEIFESVGGKVAEGLDFMLGTNGTVKASFDSTMDIAKDMMTPQELEKFEKELEDEMGNAGKQEENKSWWCERVGWFCS